MTFQAVAVSISLIPAAMSWVFGQNSRSRCFGRSVAGMLFMPQSALISLLVTRPEAAIAGGLRRSLSTTSSCTVTTRSLLGDVLGKCSVGHHPQGKTVGGRGCGVVELSERLRVTPRGSLEQRGQVKLQGRVMAQAGWALIHSPARRSPPTYIDSRRSDPLSGTARTRKLRIAATGVETERSPLHVHFAPTCSRQAAAACTACRGWHGRSSRQPSK
jgi:hypothetical protein